MTELIYLKNSYLKTLKTNVTDITKKGNIYHLILRNTIFYPVGGGQPSDRGKIVGKKGTATVKSVRLENSDVIHEAIISGLIYPNESVECVLDWDLRFYHMRLHTAGHIVHEAINLIFPNLKPIKAEHGNNPFIEYEGFLMLDSLSKIEYKANEIVTKNLPIKTEFVTLDELKERASFIPEHLPKNKPLRIMQVGDMSPIPDGGTQLNMTGECGDIKIVRIENKDDHVKVYYNIEQNNLIINSQTESNIDAGFLISELVSYQANASKIILENNDPPYQLKLNILGSKSEFQKLSSNIKNVSVNDKSRVGIVINEIKKSLESLINEKNNKYTTQKAENESFFDPTEPGIMPPSGHLHIVTQAIMDISRIFEHIGFTRVRHPEADWDWYAFESLNMPPQHPARDEWETFHIKQEARSSKQETVSKFKNIVLTPHTSNGQVREMEKGRLPIRMINIAKCYRRQIDVSHTPMFHQFEGLYIDKNVSIAHLKGVIDYFVKNYYGENREFRIRPFHFQFTEPSFEIDVSCGICLGKGKLPGGGICRLCKSGWLELGGAGMVHPQVIKNGGINPDDYSGFAFGWGIERTYMMKSNSQIDDIRLIYGNDIRFLEQF